MTSNVSIYLKSTLGNFYTSRVCFPRKALGLLLLVGLFYFPVFLSAQAPQQINYQGVARNANGEAISFQDIGVKISIIDSIAGNSTIVYQETRRVRTNYAGLFSFAIGDKDATVISGSIKSVVWAVGVKFIELAIDPTGLSNYSLIGRSQLQSVPFALYSAAAGPPSGIAGGDLIGLYPYLL